jgi:hypothetical protein
LFLEELQKLASMEPPTEAVAEATQGTGNAGPVDPRLTALREAATKGLDIRGPEGQRFQRWLKSNETAGKEYSCLSTLAKQAYRKSWADQQFQELSSRCSSAETKLVFPPKRNVEPCACKLLSRFPFIHFET